jgi:hypothetical protein
MRCSRVPLYQAMCSRLGDRSWTSPRPDARLRVCDREWTACGGESLSKRRIPAPLANFYSELLGWPVGHEEPGTAILAAPTGSTYLVFQEATDYHAPVWPPVNGKQRPMMHLDFQVGDLDSAVAEAVALGASVAAAQPQENVRVLLDTAGHPFCLCRDDG